MIFFAGGMNKFVFVFACFKGINCYKYQYIHAKLILRLCFSNHIDSSHLINNKEARYLIHNVHIKIHRIQRTKNTHYAHIMS